MIINWLPGFRRPKHACNPAQWPCGSKGFILNMLEAGWNSEFVGQSPGLFSDHVTCFVPEGTLYHPCRICGYVLNCAPQLRAHEESHKSGTFISINTYHTLASVFWWDCLDPLGCRKRRSKPARHPGSSVSREEAQAGNFFQSRGNGLSGFKIVQVSFYAFSLIVPLYLYFAGNTSQEILLYAASSMCACIPTYGLG